jgi:hypothetical protein
LTASAFFSKRSKSIFFAGTLPGWAAIFNFDGVVDLPSAVTDDLKGLFGLSGAP